MQTYKHDYTWPSLAVRWLCRAQEAIRHDEMYLVPDIIDRTKDVLEKYLNEDNMVPDDDTASGWYRAQDVDNR